MIERTGLVLVGLLLFGVFYDRAVGYLEREGYAHGYMAFIVAAGVIVTLGGAAALIGLEEALLALACFAASGLPMALGSVARHIQERKAAQEKLDRAIREAYDEAEGRRVYVPPGVDDGD